MTESKALDEEELIDCIASMSNWGRWGADDRRGMLNLITPAKSTAAAALVREGRTVACGRLLRFAPAADVREAPMPPQHFMLASGEVASKSPSGFAFDWLSIPLHGGYVTHLDAPSHVFWKGRMYNDVPAARVTTVAGALDGSIEPAAAGIVTRGVLLDVPRARGVDWLEGGDLVTEDDLRAAEALTGVQVEAGDALYVRTGYDARREAGDLAKTGLRTDCLRFLHERQPAVLATDCGTDVHPSGYQTINAPVHVVGIVAMGMWFLDNCDLRELAEAADSLQRSEFLTSIAALRLKNSTGSPVNPLAVF